VTAFIVVMAVIFVLLIFMWVAIGMEPGPGPGDVAMAYEGAWDDLDFDLLYDLSGEELRDGMRRERLAVDHERVSIETSVTGHQTALVVTRVETADGVIHDNVMLEKRSNGWVVVGYSLRPEEQRGDEQRAGHQQPGEQPAS